MFFFWSGLNSIGIDEVDVGFYPEARLRGKADSHSIRDVVSTRTKVFSRFLLKNPFNPSHPCSLRNKL